MNVFKNIFRLAVGDFIAKALNFLAFVYLARMLGVATYGLLEFAIALIGYFLLFADGGIELWSIREAASGKDLRNLVSRTLPLRLTLAIVAFLALLLITLFLPAYPGLRPLVILFGFTLLTQAINLKWVFMGQERMTSVAVGLILTQIIFSTAVLLVVQSPASFLWIPVLRIAAELAMAVYFGWFFVKQHGGFYLGFTLRKSGEVIRPALTLGASHGLALMNYSFDSILLGLLAGPTAVGLYSAAYKPVTVVLGVPATYFMGLFPTLSRAYSQDLASFRKIATRSFRLAATFAVPVGVGGLFLAAPIMGFLFGPAYLSAVPALQILGWSAVLVILRGTFRQSLNGAGKSRLDLRCATASVLLNVTLNLLLIPRYGIIGAAIATVTSEVLWFSMAYYYFNRYIASLKLFRELLLPITGAAVMTCFLLLSEPLHWILRLILSTSLYFVTLWFLGQHGIRALLPRSTSSTPAPGKSQQSDRFSAIVPEEGSSGIRAEWN